MSQPTLADKKWLDTVIAAGIPVVDHDGVLHDGTDKAAQAAAQERVKAGRDDLSPIIPVRPTHSDHEIKVVQRDGTVTRLFPILRWGNSDEAEWYELQIGKCKAKLVTVEDEGDMRDLTARVREFEWKRLQLYIEDVPRDLLTRLDPAQQEIIWVTLQRMEMDSADAISAKKNELWGPVAERRQRSQQDK